MAFRRSARMLFFITFFSCWLAWDFSQADKNRAPEYESYKLASTFNAVTEEATVAIVRSDDAALQNPLPINDANIDDRTIEQMVRRAIALAGGLDGFIRSGDMVLIKPNIVDPEEPGTGEVTDVRVVKALIKVVNDIDPGNMDIVIGEGSPRPMDYEMKYQTSWSSPCWQELWDVCGYQDLLKDPELAGITLRLSNLNGSPPEDPWRDLVEVELPNGQASPQGGRYWIHKDVLNADAYIAVPVMKIHTVGMTCALKNQIGLAPSTKYGFSKNGGIPQDGRMTKLTHHSQAPKHWTDKEIVDLSALAGIDFVVVDALACLERSKSAERKNGVITNLVRMNTVLAGVDPVATDHVCARLMGLNPDDMEHITLAERVGLGTNQAADIKIVGADIASTARRFIKSTAKTGDYGQGNRDWIVSEAFSIDGIDDPIDHPFLLDEAEIAPQPGRDGWSEPLYFTDDRIDLYSYFDKSRNIVSYAFAYFDALKAQEAELWLGSDEAMKIWLNGEIVYDYDKTRTFADDDLYLDKVNIAVSAGENRLLVKTLHKFSRYDFSVNICEPVTDSRYDGNRIAGKFKTSSAYTAIKDDAPGFISDFQVGQAYPNPFNHTVRLFLRCSANEHVTAMVYNIRGERVNTLLEDTIDRGEHILIWNGTDDENNVLTSGTYFIQIHGPNQTIVRKLSFVR
ncbi:DUF362 domain-containing protein [candidate division KSB1 bacterium]|nr:DUF362 domain-containing protein [candidate division KSB1 bacterium]RQW01513.1 MAG: DUF362 domain-containing protein [candidate division KSB1 bacterium]